MPVALGQLNRAPAERESTRLGTTPLGRFRASFICARIPGRGDDMALDVGSAEMLRTCEAAARLGVSESLVRILADSGQLVAIKTRLGRLIDPSSVERLRAERAPRQVTAAR